MKNLIALILVSVLIVNCKSEGGGSSSSGSTSGSSKIVGDFIPNTKAELGPIAQWIIDNDATFNNWYNARSAQDTPLYGDSQILHGIRGYVNAQAKGIDGNGEMDVTLETPMDAFMEAVGSVNGASRGVSRTGLCYLYADILNSFNIDSTVILITGSPYSIATDGKYCLVEVHLPNGDIVNDPLLNRTFGKESPYDWTNLGLQTSSDSWFSASDLFISLENNLLYKLQANPDGMINAYSSWRSDGDFYHTYDNLALEPAKSRDDTVGVLYDAVVDNITYVNYSDVR